MASARPGGRETALLAPAREVITPASSRARKAFWMVLGLTPSRAESTRREGSSSPSRTVPAAMPRSR